MLKEDPDCRRAKVVERWQPTGLLAHGQGVRIDLFGADVQALYEGYILAIQACDMGSRAAHVTNAMMSDEVADWLGANGAFQVWAWRKLKEGNVERWRVEKTGLFFDDEGTTITQLIDEEAG